MEINNGSVNPFANEQTYTKEQLRDEIKAELANLERRKAYLIEVLATVDPETKAREDFIDECHLGG